MGNQDDSQPYATSLWRLVDEFGTWYSPATIDTVLAEGISDLAGAPPGALPELAERVARQRLENARERHGTVARSAKGR